MIQLFDIESQEDTITCANPYQVHFGIHFFDGLFEQYIGDVCVNKKVSLYEMHDPIKKFFRRPSFVIRIDRLEEIMKFHKGYFNPNMSFPLDITRPLSYGFTKEITRAHFKKQMIEQLRLFLTKEAKYYIELQNKLHRQKSTLANLESNQNQAVKLIEDVNYDVHVSKDGRGTPIEYDRKKIK